jgi:hypothetical protein
MSLPHTKLKRRSLIAFIGFLWMTNIVLGENLQNQLRPTARPAAVVPGVEELNSLAFLILQVDRDLSGPSDLSASNTQENCINVKERVRNFTNYSCVAALVLAIALYALAMMVFPKSIPPSLKWLAAPVVSALIVSAIVANFAGYQLARSCVDESNSFRIDTFTITAVSNTVVVLVLFSVWSAYLYHRRNKRLRAAAE